MIEMHGHQINVGACMIEMHGHQIDVCACMTEMHGHQIDVGACMIEMHRHQIDVGACMIATLNSIIFFCPLHITKFVDLLVNIQALSRPVAVGR